MAGNLRSSSKIWCINWFIWIYLQTYKKKDSKGRYWKWNEEKKALITNASSSSSIRETTLAVGSQQVVTSPSNPPFDKDFFVSMFKHFAADIDKKNCCNWQKNCKNGENWWKKWRTKGTTWWSLNGGLAFFSLLVIFLVICLLWI